MTDKIYQKIKHATTLQDVREGLEEVLRTIKVNKDQRIGYVAGIISSDGDENIEKNIQRLEYYTKEIQGKYSFPVFSSVDVFGNGIYSRLEEMKFERELRENHFQEFWKWVLESGYVTDIFMTPRWEESEGAKDEYLIAMKGGLNIVLLS